MLLINGYAHTKLRKVNEKVTIWRCRSWCRYNPCRVKATTNNDEVVVNMEGTHNHAKPIHKKMPNGKYIFYREKEIFWIVTLYREFLNVSNLEKYFRKFVFFFFLMKSVHEKIVFVMLFFYGSANKGLMLNKFMCDVLSNKM